jgi:hypothetical protein
MDGMPTISLADRITKTTYASIIAAEGESKQDSIINAGGGVHDIFDDCEKHWKGAKVEELIEKGKYDYLLEIERSAPPQVTSYFVFFYFLT